MRTYNERNGRWTRGRANKTEEKNRKRTKQKTNEAETARQKTDPTDLRAAGDRSGL